MENLYQYALWLLSKRSYSRLNLANKIQLRIKKLNYESESELFQNGPQIVENILRKLEDKQLLDDQKHKEIIIRRYQHRWGFQKVKMKLAHENIELTKEQWNQNSSDNLLTFEGAELPIVKKAKKYWDKYSRKYEGEANKIKQKVIQSLMSQGHDYQEIKSTLQDLQNPDSQPN